MEAIRRFPFTRLGMLLWVGSLFVSFMIYYLDLASRAAHDAGALPDEPRDIWDEFLADFLFAPGLPTFLFWGGVALCVLGITRSFLLPRRPRR